MAPKAAAADDAITEDKLRRLWPVLAGVAVAAAAWVTLTMTVRDHEKRLTVVEPIVSELHEGVMFLVCEKDPRHKGCP